MALSALPDPDSETVISSDIVVDDDLNSHLASEDITKLLPHRHTPLSSTKSIRLLEVHTGPSYQSIYCTLSQHSLNDEPQYIALSYTWDQGGRHIGIQCDGMSLEIGENLWHFLCEFRRRQWLQEYHSEAYNRKVCHLWIDALCIDQSNVQERSHQVAQMRDIYTSAESVIVWLGSVQGDEELAFLLTRHPDLLKVEKCQDELLALLDKRYFTRVWVVQEFVLAKVVTIWCGELCADALAFDKIWREDKALPGYSKLSVAIASTPAWPLFSYRRDFRDKRKQNEATQFRLRDLLLSFENAQSSEAYDKVYGFLGIALPSDHDGHSVQPDYSKPPVEILVDVLRNQYSQQETVAALGNYELLVFLMRTLKVSRMDLVRYVLREAPSAAGHLYLLTTSDLVSATICKLGMITAIGSFEHVDEHEQSSIKVGLSESSTSLYELSNSDVQVLVSALADSKPTLDIDFDAALGVRGSIQRQMESSTHSLMQALYSNKYHDGETEATSKDDQHATEDEINAKSFQHILTRSLFGIAETCSTLKQHKAYSERYYATFTGTNDLMGVMCAERPLKDAPRVYDDIYVFENGTHFDRALIVNGRNFEELEIVGIALTAKKPKSDTGSPTMVQSWQKLFRSGSGETKRSILEPRESSWVKDKRTDCCFHCSLPQLIQLIRSGLLNEAQLNRLLERSLKDAAVDETHKCKLGSGENPSLEFVS